MKVPERLLLGPGPSPVSPRVMQALGSPIVSHLDPAMMALLDDLRARLGWVFGADSNAFSFAVSGTGTAGAALSCTANPDAAPSGVASFTGCKVSLTGTGYRLRATSGSLTATSVLFDISAGVPEALAFSTQPGNGTGGSALSRQPDVHVTDAGGNPAAGPVTLAIAQGTGAPGASLSCTQNPVSSVNGTAAFAGCADDDMIEELDLQKLGRLPQPSRQPMIGLARGWITRRMVVHHDHGVGGIDEGRAKDIARVGQAFVDAA